MGSQQALPGDWVPPPQARHLSAPWQVWGGLFSPNTVKAPPLPLLFLHLFLTPSPDSILAALIPATPISQTRNLKPQSFQGSGREPGSPSRPAPSGQGLHLSGNLSHDHFIGS